MVLSKEYMQFLEKNSINKLHKKLRDIVNRNDALEDLIKLPDDLIHLVKSYTNDKGENLPGLENLIKFFRDKMKPGVIARLFRNNGRNDDEIIKFINEYQSLMCNTGYVMPFKIEKIGEDTFLCYRRGTPSGSENLVKLTPHPINPKKDNQPLQRSNYPLLTSLLNEPDDQPLDPRVKSTKKRKRNIDQPPRPSVITYAERPSGQQPETSGQADMNTGVQSSYNAEQPLDLRVESTKKRKAEQPLDLRVDSAKKRKYDFESRVGEVSVEKTTLKRRSC
ncbi:hypothetical protein [Wolbachia endosymbiont of Folsomia candida]|uniref:hypothetical protein n=1 Tax=Wolbachia endosymbiont of Folsomia candida TaxID=169402 RepID=UPI000AC1D424|nr:hypothetical protein [Wolbachia endosymbiont of Folsomia candida]APR98268.1 hypothetical protein ASM33_03105 [Wolbachia endosymbiont of Folsomia candida]